MSERDVVWPVDMNWMMTTSWWKRAVEIVENLEGETVEPATVPVPAPMLVALVVEIKVWREKWKASQS